MNSQLFLVFVISFGVPIQAVLRTDQECSKLISKCEKLFSKWNKKREECLEDCLFRNEFDKDSQWTLVEGDMLMSEEKINYFYQISRKIRMPLDYRWPNGTIPFSIHKSSEPDKSVILSAINLWVNHTCLIFNEVPEHSKFPHIIFQKRSGCFSPIGREYHHFEQGQILSIGLGCNLIGTIAHEIGHAIGFLHEHTRRDRDKYVKVLFENILEARNQNFLFKYNSNNYGIPYDPYSIMHYNSKTFSKNGKNTIVTMNPMDQLHIGQRVQLSFFDIKTANVVYHCSDHCSRNLTCQNKGFVDKYCKCQCAPEFTGDNCETRIEMPPPFCGGKVNQTTELMSPKYPKNSPPESKCIWMIKAPENQLVNLTFEYFNIYPRNELNIGCRYESIEIRSNDTYTGEYFCGEEANGKTFISLKNEMIVLFCSNFNETKGFKARVEFFEHIESEEQLPENVPVDNLTETSSAAL